MTYIGRIRLPLAEYDLYWFIVTLTGRICSQSKVFCRSALPIQYTPLSSVVRPHTENKRTVLQCSGDFDFGSVNFRSTQPETVSDDIWQSTSITSDAAPMTDNCMNTRDTWVTVILWQGYYTKIHTDSVTYVNANSSFSSSLLYRLYHLCIVHVISSAVCQMS